MATSCGVWPPCSRAGQTICVGKPSTCVRELSRAKPGRSASSSPCLPNLLIVLRSFVAGRWTPAGQAAPVQASQASERAGRTARDDAKTHKGLPHPHKWPDRARAGIIPTRLGSADRARGGCNKFPPTSSCPLATVSPLYHSSLAGQQLLRCSLAAAAPYRWLGSGRSREPVDWQQRKTTKPPARR